MNNSVVSTNKVFFTPSEFSKASLLYLQEVGITKTLKKHTSSRKYLDSYLFFVVLEGNGSLDYGNKKFSLSKNDAIFIDCDRKYSHTSDNWKIAWIHFNGNSMKNIYNEYLNRNGKICFNSDKRYIDIIVNILNLANSNNYSKDLGINAKLSELLLMIMSDSVYSNSTNRIYNINYIKEYIDEKYASEISLNNLSNKFYINKYYLTRLFKDSFGITIINYLNQVRVTKSKELLRYSDLSIEEIAVTIGFKDQNYFSRVFKKIDGISPREYKNKW